MSSQSNLPARMRPTRTGNNAMRKAFFMATVFVVSLLSSCATPPKPHIQRFKGNWTVGAAFSWFVPDGSTTTYFLSGQNIPPEVDKHLSTQSHPDPRSESGESSTVHLVFDGYLNPQPPERQPVPVLAELDVYKLIQYGPAHGPNEPTLPHTLARQLSQASQRKSRL